MTYAHLLLRENYGGLVKIVNLKNRLIIIKENTCLPMCLGLTRKAGNNFVVVFSLLLSIGYSNLYGGGHPPKNWAIEDYSYKIGLNFDRLVSSDVFNQTMISPGIFIQYEIGQIIFKYRINYARLRAKGSAPLYLQNENFAKSVKSFLLGYRFQILNKKIYLQTGFCVYKQINNENWPGFISELGVDIFNKEQVSLNLIVSNTYFSTFGIAHSEHYDTFKNLKIELSFINLRSNKK